jgi:hypothetical protein
VGPADPNEVIQPIVSLKYRNWVSVLLHPPR